VPDADHTPKLREELFNRDHLDQDARRDYFLLSAANQAGIVPTDIGPRGPELFTSDSGGHPVLKSYDDIAKDTNLAGAQASAADASYKGWADARNTTVNIETYNDARDSVANGSYYYEPVHDSPWHDDNSARSLLYGGNVAKDGKVDPLFESRVPTDTGKYYVPPWKQHN
jgi:hypothetical protein